MSTSSPIASSSRLSSSHTFPSPRHQLSKQTPLPRSAKPSTPSAKGKERERAQDAIDGRLPLPTSPREVKIKTRRVRRRDGHASNEAGPSTYASSGDEDEVLEEWSCESLVEEEGKEIVPTVFSADGRYFFKAIGTRIHIHSTAGPHHSLISTLPASSSSHPSARLGHTHPITSLVLHPSNPLQLLSSSLDGTIILWSWTTSTLVRQIDAGYTYEFLAGYKDVRKLMVDGKREGKLGGTGMGRGVGRMVVGLEDGKPFVYASLVPMKAKGGAAKLFKDIIVRIPLRQIALPHSHDSALLTMRQRVRTARANMHILGHTPTTISSISVSPRGTYLLVASGKDAFVRRLDVPVHVSSQEEEVHVTIQSTALEHAWLKVSTNTTIRTGSWCPVDGLGLPEFMRNRDEEWFATGEHKGSIKLWYGLAEAFEGKRSGSSPSSAMTTPSEAAAKGEDLHRLPSTALTNTTLHWHAHAVSSLVFHPTGTQLLSGGEENVLVTWELDNLKESFVPRVGTGGIVCIGTKPTGPNGAEEEVWVRTRDGSTRKIGLSTGSTTGVVGKGAKLDQVHEIDPRLAYPLAYHVPTGAYVLPSSHPSILQFYHAPSASVLFEIEITPSNRVSRRETEELESVRVESVCFSQIGEDGLAHWMATSESREGDRVEGGGRAKAIKLWEWTKGGYTLNTHLTRSHDFADITSTSFASISTRGRGGNKPDAMFLSTSADGIAKLWHVRKTAGDAKDGNRLASAPTLFWSLRSSFSYRSLPVTSSAFSPDHSLIALAHGSVITLWDTASNVMLRVLECGGEEVASRVAFVGGPEGGRWLVVVGKQKGVGVWDLLAGTVAWALTSFPAHSFLVSPLSPQFTVLSAHTNVGRSTSTSIHMFSPISYKPTASGRVSQRIISPVANPSVGAGDEILALSAKGVPLRIGPDLTSFVKPVMALQDADDDSILTGQIEGMSIWEEMFGKGVFASEDVVLDADAMDVEDGDEHEHESKPDQLRLSNVPEKRGKYSAAFDGPSHTLPPTSILFDSFLADFLKPNREAVVMQDQRRANARDGFKSEVYEEDKVVVTDGDDVQASEGSRTKVDVRAVSEREVKELGEWFKTVLGETAGQSTWTAPASSTTRLADSSSSSTPVKHANKKAATSNPHTPAAVVAMAKVNGHGQSPKVGQKRKNE